MDIKVYSNIVAKILINEILPRQKKYGIIIPSEVMTIVAIREYFGEINRHTTRQILNKVCEVIVADRV